MACCVRFLLTCARLMTSSHSEGNPNYSNIKCGGNGGGGGGSTYTSTCFDLLRANTTRGRAMLAPPASISETTSC